jgi:hypothetical protein
VTIKKINLKPNKLSYLLKLIFFLLSVVVVDKKLDIINDFLVC